MQAPGGDKHKRPLAAFVCTITPFDASGALDENGVIDLCRRLGDAGVGAYLGSASPGEGYALSIAETARFYELALDAAAGRISVRGMGVEPHTPGELRPLIQLAQSVGLDAAQPRVAQIGEGQTRARELGAVEGRSAQGRTAQVAVGKVDAVELRAREIRAAQLAATRRVGDQTTIVVPVFDRLGGAVGRKDRAALAFVVVAAHGLTVRRIDRS